MHGMDEGKLYGARHQGNPQMPGFGVNRNTGQLTRASPTSGPSGMLTPEAGVGDHDLRAQPLQRPTVKSPVAGTSESPTFANVPKPAESK